MGDFERVSKFYKILKISWKFLKIINKFFQIPTNQVGAKSRVDPTKKPGFIDFSIDFQRFQARTLGALGASQRAFGRVWAILDVSPNFAKNFKNFKNH